MKNVILAVIFLLSSLSVIFSQDLVINEFMAENTNTIEDPDEAGAYEDWIEIYNNTQNDISLSGIYLTNDLNNLTKWQYSGNYMLVAGGYVLFWADGEDYQGERHTNFTLPWEGGTIALVSSNGTTIIDSLSYGEQSADISMGRFPDGANNLVTFDNPTPSAPNSQDNDSPYYHQIYSAVSNDGINWQTNQNMILDHASVPGAVFFNNKIYLYYVNAQDRENEKLSVAISDNNGEDFQEFYDVTITGNNSPNPVDPNPIVDAGKIRLTYVGNFGDNQTFDIVTATSTDGINFTEENVLFSDFVFDPDLFYDNQADLWTLFMNDGNNRIIKATSSSIAQTFTKEENFLFEEGGTSSTHLIGGNRYTYYADQNGINVTQYQNGQLSDTPIAENIINFQDIKSDPTVATLDNGNYIMYFKTKAQNSPLPIVLASFTGSYNGNSVILNWTTYSENNLCGWNIYKNNENNFETSKKLNSYLIPANGTTSQSCNYDYFDIDNLLPNSTYYYWLEAQFYYQDTELFGPKTIKIKENENNLPPAFPTSVCLIYPTPFDDNLFIKLTSPQKRIPLISIYDIKGRLIRKLSKTNESVFYWDGRDKNGKIVSNGVYFVKVNDKNGIIKKIIKLK